jgi:hypothetical protein
LSKEQAIIKKVKGGAFFMKTLIGGAIGAVIGIVTLAVWFGEFLQLLAGAVPIMLLLGGGLALYLGFDELKDTWKSEGKKAEE